jgi:glycosyltransferase involved in cell wall biosynthesis
MARRAVFVVNLLQDVNIVRPLVYMAARDLRLPTEILLTEQFIARDTSGIWQGELYEISANTGASLIVYRDDVEALQMLQGQSGALIAASESNLSAHKPTHNLFRLAPQSFLRITLQHGFECVGFLQNREHDLAHGKHVIFAADVLCGWCESSRLKSMHPSQRSKLYVSGSPAILQRPVTNGAIDCADGIVCENLHSVRLNASGDFKTSFISIFEKFCLALAEERRTVTLRPHPGGQYVIKNSVPLPTNVTLNNEPIYKVDLTQYSYGVSAPSSVVIDMVLAGLPVGVWRDESGGMDASNYEGLTEISTLDDWLDFSRQAVSNRNSIIERQQRFLEQQKMPTDASDVYRRFAKLLGEAGNVTPINVDCRPSERVLFIANDYIPTLQLSFVKPLAGTLEDDEVATEFLTEEQLKEVFGKQLRERSVESWIARRLASFRPTILVFCRYSGPHFEYLINWARNQGIPSIYHIDDDLLSVPLEVGARKHHSHNRPERLACVRHLLDNADLVYASTLNLARRLKSHGIATPIFAQEIYCAGSIIKPAINRSVQKIGYMGFDHAHNFEVVVPSIVQFLKRNPTVQFELFGSIPKPAALQLFGNRVSVIPPVRNYDQFLNTFAELNWDIGICPLTPTDFNLLKADTKWVEYTSVGAAVIATANTVYDNCCADGCGLLVTTPDEWLDALETLVRDPATRYAQVAKAQAKLETDYSLERLKNQVMRLFERAKRKPRERILFIATSYSPTVQLSFVKPLAPLVESGDFVVDFLTVDQMKKRTELDARSLPRDRWIEDRIKEFKPTMLVFSRYNGPCVELITTWAREAGIPTIFHIDDDLLNVPADIGSNKHSYHNNSTRLAAVRHLLDNADLIYASTPPLKKRFQDARVKSPVFSGEIYCSGHVLTPAIERPFRKFGYMASIDHAHNLNLVLPAIIEFLDRHPDVRFELFGTIPKPDALKKFGDRISAAPAIAEYDRFIEEFAKREWDVGICPLTSIDFNLMKANTKWVEYTSVGAAVIASGGTVYDACCADGCGILASTTTEWLAAFERLRDPHERFLQVTRAQKKMIEEYSIDRLRAQVLDVFGKARSLASAAAR